MRQRILPIAGISLVTGLLSLGAFRSTFSTPADRLREDVKVASVDVGGATRGEAKTRLGRRLRDYRNATIVVATPDGLESHPVTALGFREDPAPTMAMLDSVAWPTRREMLLTSWLALERAPVRVAPVVSIDQDRLRAWITEVSRRFDRAPSHASLSITPDGTIVETAARTGRAIDREETARRTRDVFQSLGTRLDLPANGVDAPAVAIAEARQQAQSFLTTTIVARAGDARWTLAKAELARWVVFDTTDRRATFAVHPTRPRGWLADRAGEIARSPRSARLGVRGGKVTVVEPSENGARFDVEAALPVLLSGLARGVGTIDLPVQRLAPTFSTDQAAALRFPDTITEATTGYAGSIAERAHNIELATSRLDGTLIRPGESFSFNAAVGRTRVRDGYRIAYGIVSGTAGAQTVPAAAGGICQVATTIFHAAFWAGLPIEERHPHSYWIPRYGQPPRGLTGLDAAVDEDAGLDLAFRNTTEHAILVHATTDGDRVRFALLGTRPNWQVTVQRPRITGTTRADPTVIRQADSTMAAGRVLQVEEARDGFDVSIQRVVSRDGQPVRRDTVGSRYAPSHNVLLIGTRS